MTLSFLTMPLSTNQLHGVFQGRKILSARGRTNKEAIGWEARSQYRGAPLTGPLAVTIDMHWPTARNHDVDNIKTLLDSLSGIVWQDDAQIVDLHLTKDIDRESPRVDMTVTTIESQKGAK